MTALLDLRAIAIISPVDVLLAVPVVAIVVLATVSNYRIGAALNIMACAISFLAAAALPFTRHPRTDLVIIDDFNINGGIGDDVFSWFSINFLPSDIKGTRNDIHETLCELFLIMDAITRGN